MGDLVTSCVCLCLLLEFVFYVLIWWFVLVGLIALACLVVGVLVCCCVG